MHWHRFADICELDSAESFLNFAEVKSWNWRRLLFTTWKSLMREQWKNTCKINGSQSLQVAVCGDCLGQVNVICNSLKTSRFKENGNLTSEKKKNRDFFWLAFISIIVNPHFWKNTLESDNCASYRVLRVKESIGQRVKNKRHLIVANSYLHLTNDLLTGLGKIYNHRVTGLPTVWLTVNDLYNWTEDGSKRI